MITVLVRGLTLATVSGRVWTSPDKDLEANLNTIVDGQGSSPVYPTIEHRMLALVVDAGVPLEVMHEDPVEYDPNVVY